MKSHPGPSTPVPAIALQLTRRVEWVDVGLGFATSSSQASSDSGLSDREEGDTIERRFAALPLQERGSDKVNPEAGLLVELEVGQGNQARWRRRPRNQGASQEGGNIVNNNSTGVQQASARRPQHQRRQERAIGGGGRGGGGREGGGGKTRASRVRRGAVLVIQSLAATCPRVLLAHWTAIMPVLPSSANAQDWPSSLLIPAFYDPCAKVQHRSTHTVQYSVHSSLHGRTAHGASYACAKVHNGNTRWALTL